MDILELEKGVHDGMTIVITEVQQSPFPSHDASVSYSFYDPMRTIKRYMNNRKSNPESLITSQRCQHCSVTMGTNAPNVG